MGRTRGIQIQNCGPSLLVLPFLQNHLWCHLFQEISPNTLKAMFGCRLHDIDLLCPQGNEFPFKFVNYLLISKHFIFFLCSVFLEDFGFELIFQNVAKSMHHAVLLLFPQVPVLWDLEIFSSFSYSLSLRPHDPYLWLTLTFTG